MFESVKNSDNSKIQKIGPKYVGTQIVPIIYKIAMKVLKCMLNTFLASLKNAYASFWLNLPLAVDQASLIKSKIFKSD